MALCGLSLNLGDMHHRLVMRLRGLLSIITVMGSVLLVTQVPVAHVVASLRPASQVPLPTEEEQRSDPAEKASEIELSAKYRRHATYQETVEPVPSPALYHGERARAAMHHPAPQHYRGSPPQLRC